MSLYGCSLQTARKDTAAYASLSHLHLSKSKRLEKTHLPGPQNHHTGCPADLLCLFRKHQNNRSAAAP
jgi:hypothetical protein